MTILLISEKSRVTKDLADAMKWKAAGGGTYVGTYEGKKLIAVSASGHLLELEPVSSVAPHISWNDTSTLTPLPTFSSKVPKPDMEGKPANLQPKQVLKNFESIYKKEKVTEIIIATDSDREGEAIGWEIVEYLKHTGIVRRAWFAAGLDKKSLTQAMKTLKPGESTKSWAIAAEARDKSDINYIFLTIAYTYYAKYGKFGHSLSQGVGSKGVVSVGRVQTPTVCMVVRRELEIKNFKPVDHFRVSAKFGDENGVWGRYAPVITQEIIDSAPVGVTWQEPKELEGEDDSDTSSSSLSRPLYTDKSAVDAFMQRLRNSGNSSVVHSYKEGTKYENPPKTFDLPSAQEAVASATGKSANIAQTILEDLYEQGYLSYARTSKQVIPINYHHNPRRNEMLRTMLEVDELKNQAQRVMNIHDGKDQQYKGDFIPKTYTNELNLEHHGIVPTTQPMTREDMYKLQPKKEKGKYSQDDMLKAYIVVCKQYIQALYPPAEFATQSVEIKTPVQDLLGNDHSLFKMNSQRVVSMGWREAFGKEPTDSSLPKLTEGQNIDLIDTLAKQSTTKPPERYTETDLPKNMASINKTIADPKLRKLLKDGIGTPATRKQIIDTIIQRGYIGVEKKKYYAYQKGIDLYNSLPEALKNAQTTGKWEAVLTQICDTKDLDKAEKIRDDFINRQKQNVTMMIDEMRNAYDANLGEKIQQVAQEVTPKMAKTVKLIATKLKLSIPRGALSDPAIASQFIKDNMGNLDYTPSDSQLNLAKKISNSVGQDKLTDEMMKDSRLLSKFIDEHKDKAVFPPSEAQLNFLKSLMDKDQSGYRVDEKAFTDLKFFDKAIDELKTLNATPPSQGQIDFINKIAEVANEKQKPKDDVFKDKFKASEYITKYKNLLNAGGTKSGTSSKAATKRRAANKKK